MLNIQTENFQFSPGVVMYKSITLGETKDTINIVKKTSIHEVRRDSLSIEPTFEIITGVRMEISMTLMEMDSSMDLYLDVNGQLDRSVIASDLLDSAGELVIAVTENGVVTAYKFPDAVLAPGFKCSIDAEGNNVIDVVFRGGSNSGAYMEKI